MIDMAMLWSDIRSAANLSNDAVAEQAFLSCVNVVIRDLGTVLDEDFDEAEDVEGELDIPAYAYNALFMGCRYNLQRRGAWAQDPDPEALNLYIIEKNQCKTAKMSGNDVLTGTQSTG